MAKKKAKNKRDTQGKTSASPDTQGSNRDTQGSNREGSNRDSNRDTQGSNRGSNRDTQGLSSKSNRDTQGSNVDSNQDTQVNSSAAGSNRDTQVNSSAAGSNRDTQGSNPGSTKNKRDTQDKTSVSPKNKRDTQVNSSAAGSNRDTQGSNPHSNRDTQVNASGAGQSTDVRIKALFWIAVIAMILPLTFKRVIDIDIWWHMQLGRTMVETMDVPNLNDFYWSPVKEAHPKEMRFTWLGDITFYLVHSIFGVTGLQLLVVLMVLLTLVIFFHIAGGRYAPQTFLLLALLTAGTYQMQLLRNAIFGLPATALICLLWWLVHFKQQRRYLIAFPILLGLWSCMHGSYFLGFGILCMMILGDVLDHPRGLSHGLKRRWAEYAVTLLLSYAAISLYNPFTLEVTGRVLTLFGKIWIFALGFLLIAALAYRRTFNRLGEVRKEQIQRALVFIALIFGGGILALNHFKPWFGSLEQLSQMEFRSYREAVDPTTFGLADRFKHALNSTFWPVEGWNLSSIDFMSPFDFSGDLYVWSSLLALVCSCVALLFSKKRLTILLPFVCLCFFGLGYVRTIGFITLFAVFIMALKSDMTDQPNRLLNGKMGVVVALICMALPYAAVFGSLNPGLYTDHLFGRGIGGFYPKHIADTFPKTFPDTDTFTTLENGGYLLYQWAPMGKKVYLDGFFAPHRDDATQHYRAARTSGNVDFLNEIYGMEAAVIGLRDSEWFKAFDEHKNWVPVMIDTGGAAFLRNSHPGVAINSDFRPQLLVQPQDYSTLEPYLKTILANRLYQIAFGLMRQGYLIQADYLAQQIPPELEPLVNKTLKRQFQETFKTMRGRYGPNNHPLIPREFEFFESFNKGQYRHAIAIGKELLKHDPNRRGLLQVIVHGYREIGHDRGIEEYQRMLDNLKSPMETDELN